MAASSRSDTRPLHSLLLELAEVERRSEIKRQVLAEHRAFNADNLFSFLARSSARGLTPEDLQRFFGAHGLAAELRDLNALVALFDLNRDGVVDRQEFKNTVLSHEQGFSDGVDSRQEPPFEVQVSLLKLFDEELGGLRAVEKSKAVIRSLGAQQLVAFFDALDAGRKGFVDVRDIYELLNRHEAGSTYTKASRVLRRLDRDRDNKVTLEEWEATFDPLLLADNAFLALGPQKRGSAAKQPLAATHSDKRERLAPASDFSYHVTPGHPRSAIAYLNSGTAYLNSGTLAYSKSPNRKTYSPVPASRGGSSFKSPARPQAPADADARQSRLSTAQRSRSRPRADAAYQDVVTVVDRSPGRHEKRTYICKKFADGSLETEERIYEPLAPAEARARDPEFRLERSILERDRSAGRRPHLSSHKQTADSSASAARLRAAEPTAARERSPLGLARPGLGAPQERLERSLQAHPELPPGFLRSSQGPPPAPREETLFFEREERFVDPRYTLDYDNPLPHDRPQPLQTQPLRSPTATHWHHSPIKHLAPADTRSKPVSPPSRKDSSQPDRKPDFSWRLSHQKSQQLENSADLELPLQSTQVFEPGLAHDGGFLEHRYDYGDKERLVFSPARDATMRDGAYRREQITSRSPRRPVYPSEAAPNSRQSPQRRDSFGPDPASREPPLKEEIITHHEVDAPHDRISNTYIRKIYSPERPLPRDSYFSPPAHQPLPAPHWPLKSEPFSPQGLSVADLDLPKNYASPGRLSSNLMANTAEYIDLVRRESDKFKKRDDLASKLSPDLKFSSLSQAEKTELVNCLKTKVALFREMEKARSELASHEAFAIAEVYRNCKRDPTSNGISFEEFRELFDSLDVPTDDKLIRLVFVRNDYDNDGSLSFFEFSELVGPFNPALRQQINARRESGYYSLADLPLKTRQAFARCLRALVEFERETDSTREVVQHRLYSLFNLIDQSNKNLIVLQDLDDILQTHGFSASEVELIALIRKFDFNMDGKISMVEFINEMSPLRNSKPFETLRNRGF